MNQDHKDHRVKLLSILCSYWFVHSVNFFVSILVMSCFGLLVAISALLLLKCVSSKVI